MSVDDSSIAWLSAPRDYELGLRNGKLVCRNPKGKLLASVPKWLKSEEVADRLEGLAQWLSEHRLECLHTIERWMLRSLVIPKDLLTRVWPDPDWRELLQNLVVAPASAKGEVEFDAAGLLRDVDSRKGIGVVDIDGESNWLKSVNFLIPYPILIDSLSEFRELASDLDADQHVDQLFRAVFEASAEQREQKSIEDFRDGVFEQLNYAIGHCRRLGYPVRGGYATCRVWEGDSLLEARYFIGDEYPESETWTGDLIFVDRDQESVRIQDVGPVTFSEGMRMASAIYSKRKVKQEGETVVLRTDDGKEHRVPLSRFSQADQDYVASLDGKPAPTTTPPPKPATPRGEGAGELAGLQPGRPLEDTHLAALKAAFDESLAAKDWAPYRAAVETGTRAWLAGLRTELGADIFLVAFADPGARTLFVHERFLNTVPEAGLNALLDGDEAFVRWLLESTDSMERFTVALSDKDDAPKVFETWQRIWTEIPETRDRFDRVAIACALVFDRKQTVKGAAQGTRQEIDAVARCRDFVNAALAGDLETDLDTLPVHELIWVVCANVSAEDLAWARTKMRLSQRAGARPTPWSSTSWIGPRTTRIPTRPIRSRRFLKWVACVATRRTSRPTPRAPLASRPTS